jgi:plasmid stability protein
MATLTIRRIDDATYRSLAELARSRNRSLQQEALSILQQEVLARTAGLSSEAAGWRQRVAGRDLGDVVADLRTDRGR